LYSYSNYFKKVIYPTLVLCTERISVRHHQSGMIPGGDDVDSEKCSQQYSVRATIRVK